jgi:hypothetical protein
MSEQIPEGTRAYWHCDGKYVEFHNGSKRWLRRVGPASGCVMETLPLRLRDRLALAWHRFTRTVLRRSA